MDGFIGEIRAFGFNFVPVDWAACDGSLISVQQNGALFAVIGTQFGGNGSTTFALPDLRGRPPIHAGSATGTSPVVVGQVVGAPTVTLASNQMAPHTHGAQGTTAAVAPATYAAAPGATAYISVPRNGTTVYDAWTTSGPTTTLAASTIGPSGGNGPHSNVSPYLAMTMCICTSGEYPPRP